MHKPAARKPQLVAEDTPERFERLTQHLRINGSPLVSKLFELQAERAKGLQLK